MEELGAEDEARVSSRAFVLRSRADSLGGRFPMQVLGAIVGFTRVLTKIWKDFGGRTRRFWWTQKREEERSFLIERVSTFGGWTRFEEDGLDPSDVDMAHVDMSHVDMSHVDMRR